MSCGAPVLWLLSTVFWRAGATMDPEEEEKPTSPRSSAELPVSRHPHDDGDGDGDGDDAAASQGSLLEGQVQTGPTMMLNGTDEGLQERKQDHSVSAVTQTRSRRDTTGHRSPPASDRSSKGASKRFSREELPILNPGSREELPILNSGKRAVLVAAEKGSSHGISSRGSVRRSRASLGATQDGYNIAPDVHRPEGISTRRRSSRSKVATADISLENNPSEGITTRRSPRRNKVLHNTSVVPGVDSEIVCDKGPSESSIRRKPRRSKAAVHVDTEAHHRKLRSEASQGLKAVDLEMVNVDRISDQSPRRHKRKTPEPVSLDMPFCPPPPLNFGSPLAGAPLIYAPYRLPGLSTAAGASSRRTNREARELAGSLDWLQLLVDIVMWKHIPQSTLLFGSGCFGILSLSLVRDMHYSVISMLAYIALFFLAGTFIKRSYLRGGMTKSSPSGFMLGERDALTLIRVLLPVINILLYKLGELFSGEPVVTLKVGLALWFFAKAGSMMSVWTLARIAFFSVFVVPKCYSTYREHLLEQARNGLQWLETTWEACGHKKAVLIAVIALAWNISSLSTRLCGAFLSAVAMRAYYQYACRDEHSNGQEAAYE